MFKTSKKVSNALLLSICVMGMILFQIYTSDCFGIQISTTDMNFFNINSAKKYSAEVQEFISEYYSDPSDALQNTNVYLISEDSKNLQNNRATTEETGLDKLKSAIRVGTPLENSSIKNLNKVFQDLIKVFHHDCSLEKLGKLDNYATDYTKLHNSAVHSKDREILSANYLSKFLQVEDAQIEILKNSHRKAVEVVKSIDSSFVLNQYHRGQNGIAIVGGEGKFNWLALLSIKQLRKIGSELPVEVIIPTLQDYEINFCENVLPELNARCVLLPQIFGHGIYKEENVTFSGYQYKVLAILASSFENVLLMDADNLPVSKPDSLFSDEVFLDHGMVTWPDYWERTTSPSFLKIADIELGKKRTTYGYDKYGIYKHGIIASHIDDTDYENVPMHDTEGSLINVSTESGQLMISKKTHLEVLLLALYYNMYGPNQYYSLFTQGSHGEGDKETFAMSAYVLNSTFYQVNSFLETIGYFPEPDRFVGTAMIQFDPSKDYEFMKNNKKILEARSDLAGQKFETIEEASSHGISGLVQDNPPAMFVHANVPKLNPMKIKESFWGDDDNKRFRLFGTTDVKHKLKYAHGDFEMSIWEIMWETLCVQQTPLSLFSSDTDNAAVCKEIRHQIQFLKANPLN